MFRALCFLAAFSGLFAFQSKVSFAKEPGHSHAGMHDNNHGGMHNNANNARGNQFGLPPFANSWGYLRAENGVYGPIWAAPGPGSIGTLGGFGGGGFSNGGGGWGWGGGWSDSGIYFPERLPYFSLYPPVYYGYDSGAIFPKSTLQSSWSGGSAQTTYAAAPQETAPAAQPLRIANPYYTAEK